MTLPVPPHIRARLEARRAGQEPKWDRDLSSIDVSDLAAFWNGGERARELALEAADRNREQSK